MARCVRNEDRLNLSIVGEGEQQFGRAVLGPIRPDDGGCRDRQVRGQGSRAGSVGRSVIAVEVRDTSSIDPAGDLPRV